MNKNSVLFFSYWYPNKSSNSFGIFVKRHAHAAAQHNKVVVLALNILKGKFLYNKTVTISTDEAGIETHHVYIETKFNKLFYVLLPLHYLILKNYISKHLQPTWSIISQWHLHTISIGNWPRPSRKTQDSLEPWWQSSSCKQSIVHCSIDIFRSLDDSESKCLIEAWRESPSCSR